MDEIARHFDEVVARIKALPANGPAQPSNELKLALYGLFRQARDGDVHGDKPGVFDLVGKFKYDAWARNRGMSKDEAMRAYVALAESFARDHGVTL
ncbi:acyl-CoA-binding protein [Rhodoblastus sp.]|uniref:acyl-CoA-binding protein n=1 Tax=Rhodoblastus sp. TaxID=1962975 RepID=UPI0035B08A0E